MGPTKIPCDVLIVEDDYDIREVLTEVLLVQGYRAVGAAHGREALDLLRERCRPRLVLLDLMMPVMSGWQFADEKRADPSLASIPVVVVSADGDLKNKAESIGADGWLRKPVEIDALLEVLRRYCTGSG
jgi:CheY-like chemotaxis protein